MQYCRFGKGQDKGKIYGFDKVQFFSRKLYSKCIIFALEYFCLKIFDNSKFTGFFFRINVKKLLNKNSCFKVPNQGKLRPSQSALFHSSL